MKWYAWLCCCAQAATPDAMLAKSAVTSSVVRPDASATTWIASAVLASAAPLNRPVWTSESMVSRASPKRPVLSPTCWTSASKLVRSEEHTSELQSLMRISYAVFCLKKKTQAYNYKLNQHNT